MEILLKQAFSVIDHRTSAVCLHAAGMIVAVDEPFETLSGTYNEPPFHIHCRTLVGPYVPGMAQRIREEANNELQNRPEAERRLGPAGEIGAEIPPPSPHNPPVGPKFSLADNLEDFRPMSLTKPDIYIPDEDEYDDVVALLKKGLLTKDNAHEHGRFAEEIVNGLGTWTQGVEGMNKLRTGAMPSELEAMKVALAEAPPAPTLYRGMFWMDDAERDALINVKPGDSIAPRTAFSFSQSKRVAEEYLAYIEDEDEDYLMGVIYKLEGGRGIDMKKFTRDAVSDQEWLVGHDLVVKSVKNIGRDLWEITVGR